VGARLLSPLRSSWPIFTSSTSSMVSVSSGLHTPRAAPRAAVTVSERCGWLHASALVYEAVCIGHGSRQGSAEGERRDRGQHVTPHASASSERCRRTLPADCSRAGVVPSELASPPSSWRRHSGVCRGKRIEVPVLKRIWSRCWWGGAERLAERITRLPVCPWVVRALHGVAKHLLFIPAAPLRRR
jgi:hypothetical protein